MRSHPYANNINKYILGLQARMSNGLKRRVRFDEANRNGHWCLGKNSGTFITFARSSRNRGCHQYRFFCGSMNVTSRPQSYE
jgi:hypothetical protein